MAAVVAWVLPLLVVVIVQIVLAPPAPETSARSDEEEEQPSPFDTNFLIERPDIPRVLSAFERTTGFQGRITYVDGHR